MATISLTRWHDLTDVQWQRLVPLPLPRRREGVRLPPVRALPWPSAQRQDAGMVDVRPFRADDSTAVSAVIVQCLLEINSRDYPEEIIARMCAYFSARRMKQLAEERQVFVAVENETVVGTVSRDGNKVFTMFVQPGMIGRGVGSRLMRHIESLAAGEGYEYMETGASITAHGFYQRLGYVDVRATETNSA